MRCRELKPEHVKILFLSSCFQQISVYEVSAVLKPMNSPSYPLKTTVNRSRCSAFQKTSVQRTRCVFQKITPHSSDDKKASACQHSPAGILDPHQKLAFGPSALPTSPILCLTRHERGLSFANLSSPHETANTMPVIFTMKFLAEERAQLVRDSKNGE